MGLDFFKSQSDGWEVRGVCPGKIMFLQVNIAFQNKPLYHATIIPAMKIYHGFSFCPKETKKKNFKKKKGSFYLLIRFVRWSIHSQQWGEGNFQEEQMFCHLYLFATTKDLISTETSIWSAAVWFSKRCNLSLAFSCIRSKGIKWKTGRVISVNFVPILNWVPQDSVGPGSSSRRKTLRAAEPRPWFMNARVRY